MKTNSCNKVNTCECDKMLHDIRYEVATNQTALMSTLADHIRNHCAHVTPEDRQYWNNKANDYQLQEIEGNIKERVIEYIKEIIDEKLESNSITYVSAVGTNGTKLGDIKLGDTILGTIYDSISNSQQQSVSVTWTDKVSESAVGRYPIGELKIGNNDTIRIYGIDTQSSGSTTPVSDTVDWNYDDATKDQSNRKKIGTLTINNKSEEIYTIDRVGEGDGGNDGVDGEDGDGTQPIYYASTLSSIPTDQDPTKWDAVQQDVYTGPSNSQWSSTPVDLESLGEGAKEWISIRRYTTQDNGTKAWGKFSTPALWAYYSKDGTPGIGTSTVNYRINVLSSTVVVSTDDEGDEQFYGSVKFQVFKNDGQDSEMKNNSWDSSNDETLEVEMDGSEPNTLRYDASEGCWIATGGSTYEGTPFTSIILRSVTNTVLAAVVIPFIMKGDKGDKGDAGSNTVQGLTGVVMRFNRSFESGTFYEDGTTPSNDGITYMDVVLYNGSYYRVKQRGNITQAPADSEGNTNDNWLLFSPTGNAAFQAFIAKFGFIENLTAREIVITKDDNTPVAGMTRGTASSSDPLDGAIRGNVRIWAGEITNANLINCPYYVTDTGFMHAGNAEVTGTINATSGSITGAITIGDANGNHMVIDPAVYAGSSNEHAAITGYNGSNLMYSLGYDGSVANLYFGSLQYYAPDSSSISDGSNTQLKLEVSSQSSITTYRTNGINSADSKYLRVGMDSTGYTEVHSNNWPEFSNTISNGQMYVTPEGYVRVRKNSSQSDETGITKTVLIGNNTFTFTNGILTSYITTEV